MFQTSTPKIESDHITATEAIQVYEELVVKLEERKATNYTVCSQTVTKEDEK